MRQSTRPFVAIVPLVAGLALVTGMAGCGVSATPTPIAPTVPTITSLPSVDEMLSEKIIGRTSAPNTIIMYVSMYRQESATFYLTGEGAQMKTQLADTGRAQIYFRNLFVTSEAASGVPTAAMLARCAGNARFFDAVNTIFTRQSAWLAASNPDTAVAQVMLGFGMSQSVENACLANQALLNGLVAVYTTALYGTTYSLPDGTQRVGATGSQAIFRVPAVVVNGMLFDGQTDASTANAAFAPTLANVQAVLK